jgi:hypothetical protein
LLVFLSYLLLREDVFIREEEEDVMLLAFKHQAVAPPKIVKQIRQ